MGEQGAAGSNPAAPMSALTVPVPLRLASSAPSPPAAARPPKGDNWLHEPKWDGFRFQIIKDGSVVRSIRATTLNTLTASRTWPKAFAMARVVILLAPTLAAELVRR